MTGPGWLDGVLATLMLLIAATCAGRPAIGRLRGRDTEPDADSLHVLMGVAMAAMFEPWLSPVPGAAWRIIFAAAAAWFSWKAIRARTTGRPATLRCAHPAPLAVECAAMVYMLLPARAQPAGNAPGMAMPGMGGPAHAVAGNPILALILALFMLGYILWTTDMLTSLPRARATRPPSAGPGRQPSAPKSATTQQPLSPGSAASVGPAGRPPLAPRLAAGYKIAMSLGMGYMLLMML